MWGRGKKAEAAAPEPPNALKDAVREARIEAAERSAVVVDLRDAEVARLELLDEALDPVFKDIPAGVELFDRGVSKGSVARLWVDAIAHVEMGRDNRQYRFVLDTRYVARRLVERERALADGVTAGPLVMEQIVRPDRPRQRWFLLWTFFFGLIAGAAALFLLALLTAPRP